MQNKRLIIILLTAFVVGSIIYYIIPALRNSTGGIKEVYPRYQIPHACSILNDAIKSEKSIKNIIKLKYTNEKDFAKILAEGMRNIQGFYNFDYDVSLNKNKTDVKQLTKNDLQKLKMEFYENYPIIYMPNNEHYILIIRKVQNECKIADIQTPQNSDCLIDIDTNIQYEPNIYGKDRHVFIFDGNQEKFLLSGQTSKLIYPH